MSERTRHMLPLLAAGLLAVASFALLALAANWRIQDQREIDHLAESTNHALCTLRADFARRVRATEEFLIEHPEGIPGITRADFARSLEGQRATLRALASLDCGGQNDPSPS